MEILGIEFTLANGEKVNVELEAADASNGSITGFWLYRDGVSLLPQLQSAIPYRRTIPEPDAP